MGDAIVWWIALQLLGLAALPIGAVLLRALPDRGYAVSKPLGILLVVWLGYLVAMSGLVRFDRLLMIICLLLVAGLSVFLLLRNGHALYNDLREHFSTRQARTYVIVSELVFLFAYILWAWIRAHEPSISSGQEKFMDYGFLNAILKSDTFPPNDQWLSGFSINYYYFGYILMAGITALSGVATEVAFNLANVALFALTALGAFGVVHNLITARLLAAGRSTRRPVYAERPLREPRYEPLPPEEFEPPRRRRSGVPANRPSRRRQEATMPAAALPSRQARSRVIEDSVEEPEYLEHSDELSEPTSYSAWVQGDTVQDDAEEEFFEDDHLETEEDFPAGADTVNDIEEVVVEEVEVVEEAPAEEEAVLEVVEPAHADSVDLTTEETSQDLPVEAEDTSRTRPSRGRGFGARDRGRDTSTSAGRQRGAVAVQPTIRNTQPDDPAYLLAGPGGAEPRRVPGYLSPYIFAILAAIMVVAMGNLTVAFAIKDRGQSNPGQAFVEGNGFRPCFLCNSPNGYNWFAASRVVADFTSVPGGTKQTVGFETINEFPAFSFLLADMHPHVLALPLVLLAISVSMAFARRRVVRAEEWSDGVPPGLEAWLSLLIAGLIAGALYTTNTWDFPTYLLVMLACLVFPYLAVGRKLGLGARWLRPVLVQGLLLVIFAIVTFLPFHLTFKSLVGGSAVAVPENIANIPIIGWIVGKLAELVLINTADKTILGFVVIFGVFLLSLLVWLVYEFANYMRRRYVAGADINRSLIGWGAFLLLTFIAAFLFRFPLLALLLPMVVVSFGLVWQEPRRTERNFALVLVGIGALIGLVIEVVFLRDNFQMRMNTLFKFYFQIWILWALPAAYALWRVLYAALGDRLEETEARREGYYVPVSGGKMAGMLGSSVLAFVFVALVLLGSLFVYYGAGTRQGVGRGSMVGLDGAKWLETASNAEFDLSGEYDAAMWLKQNGNGSQIVLEAADDEYDYPGRMSTFSGVPTLLAWDNSHERLWRTNQPEALLQIQQRRGIINAIYQGQDPNGGSLTAERLLELLRQYGVDYVAVGAVERGWRLNPGNRQAGELVTPYAESLFAYALPVAFSSGGTTIYSVGETIAAVGAVPPTPDPNAVPGATAAPTQPVVDPNVEPVGLFANTGAGLNRGQFNLPRGIARDAEGNFYVADTQNLRIQKFDAEGNWLLAFGSRGTGPGQFTQLNETGEGTGPGGIAVDAEGNVYVADTWNHRIQKFDSEGNFVLSWGGFISLADPASAADPAANVRFYGPRGVAVGPDGNVYVTDTGNKRVLIFATDGTPVREIGSDLTPDKITSNYPFDQPGEMNEPIGIAVDTGGNVYVADTRNFRIQKFGPDGAPLAQWPIPAPSWDIGPYLEPFLAVDSAGNVYATAPTGKAVLKFDQTGAVVGQVASAGDLPLQLPTGIWSDPDGTLYVVDTDRHTVLNAGIIP